MQEFLLTLVVIFVLFRVFGNRKGGSVFYTVHQHHYGNQPKSEEKVKVQGKSSPVRKPSKDEGEYVDFEEIK